MQASWRQDADKLTFIICVLPLVSSPTATETCNTGHLQIPPLVTSGKDDAPEHMIGDVNLFLYPCDEEGNGEDEDEIVVGELEIMIARAEARGNGLAREALQAFMWYVMDSLPAVLEEYTRGCGSSKKRPNRLSYLRVKIDKDNTRSLGLFETLGFCRVSEPNYFGEVELRLEIGEKKRTSMDAEDKEASCSARKLSYGHASDEDGSN